MKFEELFGMRSGYVLGFSNQEFAEIFRDLLRIDIYSEKYSIHGDSKANRLRAFWEIEENYNVAKTLLVMLDIYLYERKQKAIELMRPIKLPNDLFYECQNIAKRMLQGSCFTSLNEIKGLAKAFNAEYLSEQINRIEQSIDKDPSLAIGTAKELIETCCKTILAERGKSISGNPDISALTKATLRELKLVPEGVSEEARGRDVIKRILSNLGAIGNGLAELRGLYGTGHGKDGKSKGLTSRHAKLAVGAAVSLATFLFETHQENKK
jgi:hypothetical protein